MTGTTHARLEFDGVDLVAVHRPGHNCDQEQGVTVTTGVRDETLEEYGCDCWGDD